MDFFVLSSVVDIEGYSDTWLLFAYLNEADCYTKLHLHSNDMKSVKSTFLL